MVVRGNDDSEGVELPRLTTPQQVMFLREFIFGVLLAKGGAARIEEMFEALKKAEEHGLIVTGGPRDLMYQIELLTEVGYLERNDGTIRLKREHLHPAFMRKLEKKARLLTAVA